MTQKETRIHEAPAQEIEDIRVEDEMKKSYIDYAMSVIVGRAIPDVRDGLKPVQRRILYTMNEQGLTHSGGHRKSANVVGETMGEYHPHGDKAIYDALARMAQPFSLRYPLIDGQGNFGSIDGDPPAAMRYTEARMDSLAEELLEGIDENIVDFKSNYDDRTEEPEVLPAKFPNLLVNGASGIAVGTSTKIPPHNISEVIDGTIHLIDNPNCDTEDLMEFIPGPDFPMGGKIVGRDGIKKAYDTGRGRITVRASYKIKHKDNGKDSIIITELPPESNKERLIKNIAEMVENDKIEGISDLRDESNRDDGVRIVIKIKETAVTKVIENKLKDTVLRKTYGIINLSIVNGEPETLTLKETLNEWLQHRKEVVRRRTKNELQEKKQKAHILEGRMKALDNTDEIVQLIRNSKDRKSARNELESRFNFSEDQAQHIVRMQLGSLTSIEEGEVQEEHRKLQKRIKRLNKILDSNKELLKVIKDELREIKEKYGDKRRTNIEDSSDYINEEDLIPEEEIIIVISEDGYMKRMNIDEFNKQKRGGKGVIGIDLKQGDHLGGIFQVNTHKRLLCFTNEGDVYETKGYEIPEYGRNARGEPDVSIFNKLNDNEHITNILAVDKEETGALTLVTKNGWIKRTELEEFESIKTTGIRAINLSEEDEIVSSFVTENDDEVMVGVSDGRSIRFRASEARTTGRTTRGVNAIKLHEDDTVIGAFSTDNSTDILTITENGYGKRTKIENYSLQSRYGKGLINIKTSERNGPVVSIEGICEQNELFVATKNGMIMRTKADEISSFGRNTQGAKIIETENDDVSTDISTF